MASGLQAYVDKLFGGEDEFLRSIREEAEREGLPTIQVPVEVGRLLTLLILQTGARTVLEIGTLFGYSGIVMARSLPSDGKLLTLEVEPRHARLARSNFQRAGVADKVELREGSALESLSGLEGRQFDLVFIDADKQTYPEYLAWSLKLVHPGSVIVADNVWRGGSVAEADEHDPASGGISRFNNELARNDRLYSTIVPTRECADATSVSIVRHT
jgi:predicted O-methyltransferase YrrM